MSCGAYYGTDSAYRATLAENTKNYPQFYETKEQRWGLRWNCGNWPYSSHWPKPKELDDAFDGLARKWSKLGNKHDSAGKYIDKDWNEFAKAVLQSACRVAERLEVDESTLSLPKTTDFHIAVSDHDEIVIASYLRLDQFKAKRIVLLPNWGGVPDQIDYKAELARVVESWQESEL